MFYRNTFPLLKLPGEIRQIIYKHCLVVGTVYPYLVQHMSELGTPLNRRTPWWGMDTPNIALLETCKLVHREAERELYIGNHFILPLSRLTHKFFVNSINTSERRLWLKSITLEFTPSDLDDVDRKLIRESRLGWYQQFERAQRLQVDAPSSDWFSMTCAQELHKAYKQYLVDIAWPRKVSPVLEHLKLDGLMINIQCSLCDHKCCPMYAGALAALSQGFALGIPKTLKIMGVDRFIDQTYFDQEANPWRSVNFMIRQWSRERGCPIAIFEEGPDIVADDYSVDCGDHWLEKVDREIGLLGRYL